MAKKNTSEFPFSLEDRMGCLTSPIVAVEESFMAVRVVYRQIFPEQRIVDHTILRDHISVDRDTSYKDRTIYYVPPASENPIQTHIAALRRNALEYGATPEAIRLLGALAPWTDKEKKIMAEKLKSKASAAKPDKEGLKKRRQGRARRQGQGRTEEGQRRGARQGTRARTGTGYAQDQGADQGQGHQGAPRYVPPHDADRPAQQQDGRGVPRKGGGKYDAGCLRYATEAGIVSLA
jgi:hypothetical protein